MDAWALRESIVAAGRRLGRRRLIAAAEGNVSARLPDGRILVTPSGRRKDELRPEDLLVVEPEQPAAGDPVTPDGRRATSDVAIHRALLAARPDVTAVVHAHLPASMALTLAGEVPDPTQLPETALFLPVLPVVPYAAMGSPELAAAIARAMTSDPLPAAAILERHGAVAVGSGPAGDAAGPGQAVDRLELVDVLCRVWRDALLVRAARAVLGPGVGPDRRPAQRP